MAEWTLDGYDRLMRDDKQVLELGWFDGEGTAELRERIIDLLNAAEEGGLIDRVTGSIEGQCLDADAWKALVALSGYSRK